LKIFINFDENAKTTLLLSKNTSIKISIALGWRKKQPIAYVFGQTMCITVDDIVTNLVKKINSKA